MQLVTLRGRGTAATPTWRLPCGSCVVTSPLGSQQPRKHSAYRDRPLVSGLSQNVSPETAASETDH
jgi:hypothetical protein